MKWGCLGPSSSLFPEVDKNLGHFTCKHFLFCHDTAKGRTQDVGVAARVEPGVDNETRAYRRDFAHHQDNDMSNVALWNPRKRRGSRLSTTERLLKAHKMQHCSATRRLTLGHCLAFCCNKALLSKSHHQRTRP